MTLNIFFVNIQSLKNNLNDLENDIYAKKSDFICLAETWLNENDNVKMPLTRFAVVGTIVNFLLTGTILVLIQVFTILFTLLVLTILQLLFGLGEGFHNSIFNFSCDVTYLVLGQVSEGNLQFF